MRFKSIFFFHGLRLVERTRVSDFSSMILFLHSDLFPLGTQWVYFHGLQKNPVLHSSLILEVASHYEFVASQVVLRWAIHMNVTVIPRSKNPRNIYLNFRALDFSLNENEIVYFTNITDYEYHPLEQKLDKGLG